MINLQRTMLRPALVAAVATALSTGCMAEGPDRSNARSISPDGTVAALASAEIPLADKAAAVVADELGLPISEITVDSVRAVEWPDSSIGCPQPDQAYGQVITPGHKITLRANGALHVVHEANGRAFLCRQTKPVARIDARGEFVWAAQGLKAREDLANVLGVPVEDVAVRSARRVSWDNTGLGCPDPTAAPARVDGYVITLRHGERDYTYHTDLNRVIACPPVSID